MMPKHEKLVLQISAKKQDERDKISDRKKGEKENHLPLSAASPTFTRKKVKLRIFAPQFLA